MDIVNRFDPIGSISPLKIFLRNFAVFLLFKVIINFIMFQKIFSKHFFLRHCSVTMAAKRRRQRRQNSRSFFHSQPHKLNGIQTLPSHRNTGQICT